VTKAVGVMPRLLSTMGGGVLACLMTGIALNRLEIHGLDAVMAVTPLAVFFTAFGVGGVANAINIIDGFHGLASGTTIIALAALAAIADRAGDPHLALACILVAAAVVGFWLVNYPWGKLFLGDGGAYFAGFALAWLAVLLPMRNPSVSVWASMLVCAYPVIEVLYSVLRRHGKHRSAGSADRLHLHSLIKTRFIRKQMPAASKRVKNAAVSPIVWSFAAAPALVAIALFDRPAMLMFALIVAAWLYHVTYRYLAAAPKLSATGEAATVL
jgi:UDP-N-acetylmuramyl pentapeptide phosphotransferase/UDP-N-acetylglucosamine-1-phosphate transferase